MRRRMLPGLGREVAVMALGTAALGTDLSLADSFHLLDDYAENGGNFLDTARVYGYFAENIQGVSEEVIGRWLKARKNRDQIAVATKGGHPPLSDMRRSRLDQASILADLEESLKALQTDHVDIFWLHRDDEERPVEAIMETLQGIVESGKALAVGASNWRLHRLIAAQRYAREAGRTPFCAVQPQWSLARQEVLEDQTLVIMNGEMYDWHLKERLPVVPYTSQAKGFFSKLEKGGKDALQGEAKRWFWSQRNWNTFQALQEISGRTGHSAGALALAFLLDQPFPVFPIVGFRTPEQMAVLQEADSITLTPEDMAALMNAYEGHEAQ